VIVDDAHRSIYGVWRGVQEYVDAHTVGLTATPGKQTFGFFGQNLVSEQDSRIEAGTFVPKVDRRTRVQRLEALDEDLEYTFRQLDRALTSTSQIRLVLDTFRDRLFTEIFPGRSTGPKTLIFAMDDNHAEEIVRTVREVFGKGNDSAAKITYTAKDPKGHLQAFRTSHAAGRGRRRHDRHRHRCEAARVRVLHVRRAQRSVLRADEGPRRSDDAVRRLPRGHPGRDGEDPVRHRRRGRCHRARLRRPTVAPRQGRVFKLLGKAATLTNTEDEVATLASRLSVLEPQLTPAERDELDAVAATSVCGIVRELVDAVDPDRQAKVVEGAADPAAAVRQLLDDAVSPLAANPELRHRILDAREDAARIQAALASAKAGSQQLSGRCCRRPSQADSPAGQWTRSRNR